MPSSRAILADIHNLSLDPNIAWSSLDKKGRLKGHDQSKIETLEAPSVKKEPEAKVSLEPVPELVEKEVEPKLVEEVIEHAHVDDVTSEVLVDNVADEILVDNVETFESSSAEFSEVLDSGSELDSFRPKKKKK